MKQRYELLDTIRAAAIINMIIYHILWDLVFIFNFDIPWFGNTFTYIWQQCICWTFIFISGFCLRFSKNPYKRGTIVFSTGIFISAVTSIFMPESKIEFGIMSLIGSSIILTAFLRPFLDRLPYSVGLIIFSLLFLLTKNINAGNFGIGPFILSKLPSHLYHGHIMTYIGFTDADFYSSDYFSIFPWLFLFLAGYYISMVLKDKKIMNRLTSGIPFLNCIGRHSLIIYILHQPAIYSVLILIDQIIK